MKSSAIVRGFYFLYKHNYVDAPERTNFFKKYF